MAQPTNTYSRYSAVGIRESLDDMIYDISPTDTPFMSNAGRGKAVNTFFEWQTESLASPDTNNAFVEGDDTAAQAMTPTVRVGNYTQISKKIITISGTLEAVDKAGRRSELAKQLAKKGKEIKRDMESIATSSQLAVAGSDSVARRTAGFDTWLKTNTSNGTSGTNYTYTTTPTAARTDGTDRAFTETLLKAVIQSQWAAGGQTKILMTGPFNKGVFSTFTGIAEQRVNINKPGATAIIGAADIYVSNFGDVVAVPNRFMPEDRAYLIDNDYVEIDFLRPFKTEELAKTGDSEKRHIVCEWGLKVTNEAAHAVVRDLIAA
jgi:hypothetical protein